MILTANIFDVMFPLLQKGFWFLQVIIAFGILIAVHEFGHYISAKLTGMRVDEFAIGFGKRIAGFKKGETEYSWRLVPLGGFCKIYGMEEEDSSDDAEDGEEKEVVQLSPEEQARGFNMRPLWARFLVIIAGSLMNILLTIFLVTMIGISIGFNYSVVEKVEPGSPADKAGMLAGDKLRLFAFNSQRGNIIDAVANSNSTDGILFRIQREDGAHKIKVFPETVTNENGEKSKKIGIQFTTGNNYSRVIERVMHNSPYQKAGLVPGDEIVRISGFPTENLPSLYQSLLETETGETDIEILRNDTRFTFTLKDYLVYRTGIIAKTIPMDDGFAVKINEVIMDTPAFYLGLNKNFLISAVDGKPITEDFEWMVYEKEATSTDIVITVADLRLEDSPPLEIPLNRIMLTPGLSFKANYVKVPLFAAIHEATLQTKAFGLMIFDFLNSLFTKKAGVDELAGPIGVVQMGYRMASEGFFNLVFLFSLISVNLGIINLLPFPGLDGGRAVFLVLEMVIRRPVLRVQYENIVHAVGLIILIGFIIFVTYNDVSRIISQFMFR